jgi:hypothetical protein
MRIPESLIRLLKSARLSGLLIASLAEAKAVRLLCESIVKVVIAGILLAR